MKAKIITALLLASMLPNLLKSQTVDSGVIQTTDNQTEWTTGKIVTPAVNYIAAGQLIQVKLNDINNTTQDGYWSADYSDNLEPLEPITMGNITGTMAGIPDSIAEQPIKINYMLSDTLYGRHGVTSTIDRRVDRYEIDCTIAYTDTATGQPTSIDFKLPNHLAKYFMDWDTTAATPFDPVVAYSSTANPEKLDSILNNIHDVMVLPEFDKNRTTMAQMNETSPYSAQGDSINSTLRNISDGGLGNPWNPEIFSMTMEDHSQKKSGYSPKPNAEGSSPPPPDDDDLETMVFKTTNGDIIVKYFMPDLTVTHPGANVVNIYEMTISDPSFKPDIQVDAGGLPTNVSTTQLNDSVYNVAVSVKTPDGQTGSYNIAVDLNAIQTSTPEVHKPVDYEATNFPNPFTDNTTLSYSLKEADDINIMLYDAQGRLVKEVFNGKQSAGVHEFSINGSDFYSGIYFYKITGRGGSQVVKIFKR
jgi:hypothetical protein